MWVILLLVIMVAIIIIYFLYEKKQNVEHYYDLVPYDYVWDIYKCYNGNCIRKKGKNCYDWCKNWPEPGGKGNCRLVCLDDSDIMYQYLKFNDYNFNKMFPRFKEFSLLNDDKGGYVA